MARCRGRRRSRANLSVSVTGIAGPGGGSPDKPIGLVHFAIARRVSVSREQLDFKALHHEEQFGDIGRSEVREASVETAFRMLRQAATL